MSYVKNVKRRWVFMNDLYTLIFGDKKPLDDTQKQNIEYCLQRAERYHLHHAYKRALQYFTALDRRRYNVDCYADRLIALSKKDNYPRVNK